MRRCNPHCPIARQLGLPQDHAAVAICAGAIGNAIGGKHLSDQAAGIGRILSGVIGTQQATLDFNIAGPTAVAWDPDDQELGNTGVAFLMRQTSQIAGGTTEMSRNVVSERLIGMPSEARNDKDVAFRDVPRSSSSRR